MEIEGDVWLEQEGWVDDTVEADESDDEAWFTLGPVVSGEAQHEPVCDVKMGDTVDWDPFLESFDPFPAGDAQRAEFDAAMAQLLSTSEDGEGDVVIQDGLSEVDWGSLSDVEEEGKGGARPGHVDLPAINLSPWALDHGHECSLVTAVARGVVASLAMSATVVGAVQHVVAGASGSCPQWLVSLLDLFHHHILVTAGRARGRTRVQLDLCLQHVLRGSGAADASPLVGPCACVRSAEGLRQR